MPELPEVETVARGLRERLLDQTVRGLELRHISMFKADPKSLAVLEGTTLRRVERGGKYLVLHFESGTDRGWQLLIHLGMTGTLRAVPAGHPRADHTHFLLFFASGLELHLRDPRRFGRVALAPAPPDGVEFAPALGVASGVEPMQASEDDFIRLFHRRQAPIKNALLNQKLLRGLGNIYADESLFRAGIHPLARAVSRPRLRRLRQAVRAVLRAAIAAGGSSISDYVGADGSRGWFQTRHRVYGRENKPCPTCGTAIRRIELAGRSAHFCPRCQKR